MPETALKRKPTQSTRRRTDRRKNEKGPRRKARNRATPAPAPIIANSLSALTLIAKPGVAVEAKRKNKKRSWDKEEDYEKMYHDLLACLHHACTLIGTPSTFDPLASGMELSVSVYYVMNAFKNNILPEGYEVNIDKNDDNGYYFTIYKECDFPAYWQTFEVKPLVKKLKYNPKLLKTFIEVIKCMMSKADIGAWWNGGMGYAEYMLDEEIADWDNRNEFDSEEESMSQFQKAVACQKEYENGEAKHYQELIMNAKYKTPDVLLNNLEKYRANNKIVKWLKEVCEFMKLPGSVNDFIYHEHEDLEGLKYDQQVTVVWDFNDRYSTIQAECLDSEAQACGINGPVINLPVTKNLKSLDPNELNERCEWPMKIENIYSSHQDLLQSFKRKKK